MLAQLAADVLKVDPAAIHVVDGDTQASPLGLGAYASRQAVTAGNAVYRAAEMVAEKIRQTGAALMEVAPEDLELADGAVRVKGVPGMKRSIAEIAHALAGVPGFALPGGLPPGLAASVDFEPPALTYTSGTHVAEAEVDPETGLVRLIRYAVVHDCGRVINPMMLDGQVLGGVVNGIGATLYEWMRYAEDGQPLTVNYADYLLPSVDTVPPHRNPSHGNADAAQPARRQGRGRERHDRCAGRHRIGDRGRAGAARRRDPRSAGDAGTAARPHRGGGEASMTQGARAAAVVGAGPAGLMAAERLAEAGIAVTVYDRMASPARKFLLAGRGGLNLTHSEPLDDFLARYRPANGPVRAAIEAFPPQRLRAWCEGLGQPTFVGTSGRVFPNAMKASPLLRAWLRRLRDGGVTFMPRHRFLGWRDGALLFERPDGGTVTDSAGCHRAGARRRELAAARFGRRLDHGASGCRRGDQPAAASQLRRARRVVGTRSAPAAPATRSSGSR